MIRVKVGIVDYGMGNHSSVFQCIKALGHKVRITDVPEELSTCDVLILPGVGAFPTAMHEMHNRGLIELLLHEAKLNKPIIGICLGMQLMTEGSDEFGYNSGLSLIPGQVVALNEPRWHIGWNTLQVTRDTMVNEGWLQSSEGESFYFNHSFVYEGPSEYCLGKASPQNNISLNVIIRRGNSIGLQFHPEKSQMPGRRLLGNLFNSFFQNIKNDNKDGLISLS